METKTENLITLSQAIRELKQEFGFLSDQAIRKALRENKIPHMRSSPGKNARIFVKMSDMQKFLSTLSRG